MFYDMIVFLERRQQRLQNTARSTESSRNSIISTKNSNEILSHQQQNVPLSAPMNTAPAPIANIHSQNGTSGLSPFQKGFGSS